MRFKILIAFFIIVAQTSFAQQVEVPTDLYYYQPAASVFGAEAVWVNPAGLALYKASDVQFFADLYKWEFAKNWGTVFTRNGFGISYRKIKNDDDTDFREYIFSSGMKFGKDLNFGASYQYFKDAPDAYNKKHLWNIGFMGKLNPQYKWGIVLSNLNKTRINDIKTETEVRYSLAYRPSGSKITLAVDAFLSTKTKIRNADFVYHLATNPIPGLYLNGFVDRHKNFEIGFRINFFQSFIGARRSASSKGHHRGTTFFYGSTNRRQESIVKVTPRRLLTNLSGRPNENPSKPFFGKQPSSYLNLLTDIYRAADDESIDEMVLSLNKLSIGFAQAEEVRSALDYFKSKKKRIICHLSYPNNLAYYIASTCDKIIVPPVTQLKLVGLKAELSFYAGTLDKIGVKTELLKIGAYKTAAETFTQEASSDANKKQINRLLDNLYGQLVSGIAKGRAVSEEAVRTLIDQGPFTTQEALDANLIDGVAYLDEIKETFPDELKSSKTEITIRSYHYDIINHDSWKEKPIISVITALGEVQTDGAGSIFSSKSDVTPYKMKRAIRQAVQNKDTKAILLRINSPGGAALAGEEIYHSLQKQSKKIPIVVSMGNVAASGGYYFAMAGETLFANRATITGSIGIFGGKIDMSELHKKIALKKELYTRGKYAGMLSQIKPFTPDEREKYFSHLKSMYDHFVQLVAENRLMTVDSIDNLGQGLVWTGAEAKENGLVDHIGGFKDALDYIVNKNNFSEYQIEIFPQKKSFLTFPGSSLFSTVAKLFKSKSSAEFLQDELQLLSPDQFYTRMPYDILIE